MEDCQTQLRNLLDDNFREVFEHYLLKSSAKNGELSLRTVEEFVRVGLREDSQEEVDYVMKNLHRLDKDENKTISYEELGKFLYFHCAQISLQIRHKKGKMSKGAQRKMTQKQFQILCNDSCHFLKVKIPSEISKSLFQETDKDKDGLITYAEYLQAIKRYFCQGHVLQPNPETKLTFDSSKLLSEQQAMIEEFWSELKKYFDKYDKGGKQYLTEDQFRAFVAEVLKQTTKSQQNYIFWNKFRVDLNNDTRITFNQFAPFVLNHAGQIALQNFHKQKQMGKSTLSKQQLYLVFCKAYGFLKTLPKDSKVISLIYDKIGNGSNPSYASYLSWIHHTLAKKVR